MPPAITYVLGTYPCPSETFIAREIAALRRRGWALDVVSLQGAAALTAPTNQDKPCPIGALAVAALRQTLPLFFHLPRLPLQLLRHLPQAAALIQRVRASGTTGIHAHFAHLPADVALLAARQTHTRFTCSVHAWDVFAQPVAVLRRRLLPAMAICACSQAAVNRVLAAGIPATRTHLIRHGIPLAEYPFSAAPREGRQILAVGRLESKKGFDLLLAACAQLPPRSFTCQIIGEGAQRRQLEQLIAAYNLQGAVTLPGGATPETIRRAMQAATVLVLPSRRLASGDQDGVANVLLEAMALGTPVITTTASAAGEVIQDGRNGCLVPADQPNALAAAIRELLDTPPQERAARAQTARTTVAAAFDEEQTIARLESILHGTEEGN